MRDLVDLRTGAERTPPLITVITVCLNESASIERTLSSMLQQQRSNVEWIVFDGRSTDGTLEKLQTVQNEITYLHSGPDGGIYPAMNQAVQHATGEYLFFLNGGDTLMNPDVFSQFTASQPHADLITGDVEVAFPDGKTQYRPAEEIEALKDRLYWRSLPHISTFIRRELFLKLQGYDLSYAICADWEFFLRACLKGATFLRWDYPVGRFYYDGLSASFSSNLLIRNEKTRLRHHYPLSYRLRRELNEWIGRQQNRFRKKSETETPDPKKCP